MTQGNLAQLVQIPRIAKILSQNIKIKYLSRSFLQNFNPRVNLFAPFFPSLDSCRLLVKFTPKKCQLNLGAIQILQDTFCHPLHGTFYFQKWLFLKTKDLWVLNCEMNDKGSVF